MSNFFCEIPTSKAVSVAEFMKAAVEWIRGIKDATVFNQETSENPIDINADEFSIVGKSSEKFEVRRVVRDSTSFVIGFRYDRPDSLGRLWRTECVLNSCEADAFTTVRVICLSENEGAKIVNPKKPYFLKLILKKGWGALDGELEVSDSPRYLAENDLELAESVILGNATILMPVVYLSADDKGGTAVDAEKLAYSLGGIAHVVVEPSREFSFNLQAATDGVNAYGGAVGVSLPEKPNVIRILSEGFGDQNDIERLCDQLVGFVSTRLTKFGLDWYSLQEEIFKQNRKKVEQLQTVSKDELFEEWNKIFGSEIQSKDDEIAQLKNSLRQVQEKSISTLGDQEAVDDHSKLAKQLPQLYNGEFIDRLMKLYMYVSQNPAGLFTERDLKVYAISRALLTPTGEGKKLKDRIKAAGNCGNPKQANSELGSILIELGFTKESEGKHFKFLPPIHFRGVEQVSFAKTPSDHRVGKNNASIIVGALGMTNLTMS